MTTNFLYQLNQHYPYSYAITLSAAKFELGLLSQISQTLASLHPAIRLLHQDTLVNELDWQANDTLAQAEQTGQAQNEVGQVIDKPIIQNNQVLGHATITMKAVSKGEIVSSQWLFVLGSAILHGFLWLIYGYMARPTQEQLAQLGEKVQQHIALARGSLAPTNRVLTADGELQLDDHDTLYNQAGDSSATAQPAATGKTINDFLNREKSKSAKDIPQTQPTATEVIDNLAQETTVDSQKQPEIELQIHFYDQYHLLKRVAPEVAKPYFQLCNQLLMRASNSLFNSSKYHRVWQ